MKKYTDLKDTPLKFHRVYSRVVLPIDAFLNISNLITLMMSVSANGLNLRNVISLGVSVLFIVLCFAAYRNLIYFRRAGLVAVWALLLLQVSNGIYNLYVFSTLEGMAVMVVAFALTLLTLLLIFLYYFKRRALFTKDGVTYEELMMLRGKKPVDFQSYYKHSQNEDFASKYQKAQEAYVPPEEEVEEEVGEYDCPRCGHHITDGAVFCPKCGAQTRAVRR